MYSPKFYIDQAEVKLHNVAHQITSVVHEVIYAISEYVSSFKWYNYFAAYDKHFDAVKAEIVRQEAAKAKADLDGQRQVQAIAEATAAKVAKADANKAALEALK